jgi:hypothetical protein
MTKRRDVKRVHGLIILMAVVSVALMGCNYGRMYDQDSIKTYERKVVQMDKRAIPVTDGFDSLTSADPRSLSNPLASSAKTVEQGRLAYSYFCVQCHGPKLDGNGSVGQSFSPLPADLGSPGVLSQDDGVIYARIRLGFKRHPRLFSTVSEEDTWAIILYLRSARPSS